MVATKIPGSGVSWVNEDGLSGLNVEPGNPKALADAIMAITKNETSRKTFSKNAFLRYGALFTKDLMINKITELYEKTA